MFSTTWFDVSFSPNSLLLGVLNSFLRCVRPLCHCWCPPFSAGHVALLFICLPGLSLLVSALLRWPCRISIHLSPRSVAAGVRPLPCNISIHLSPRSVTGGVRPFPLAMWSGAVAFYSFVSQVCRCWCPPFSLGHVEFLFMCLPGMSLLVSALFRWRCNISIRVVPAGVRPFPLAM